MVNFYKKWQFWIILIVILIVIYNVLIHFGFIPAYQCGSTIGPDGPVDWCAWHYGTVVG